MSGLHGKKTGAPAMWGVVGRGVWRMRGLWGDWSGEGHEVDRRREDVTNLWLRQENKKHVCTRYRAVQICRGLLRRL